MGWLVGSLGNVEDGFQGYQYYSFKEAHEYTGASSNYCEQQNDVKGLDDRFPQPRLLRFFGFIRLRHIPSDFSLFCFSPHVQPPPKRLNMKMEIGHLAEDGFAVIRQMISTV